MKKLTLVIILSLSIFFANSQVVDYYSTFKLNTGFSLAGSLVNRFDNTQVIVNKSFTTPVAQLSYDYRIERWFSLGVAVSHQYFGMSFFSTSGSDDLVALGVNRVNVGIRPYFHYYSNEVLDFYAGARIGGTIWHLKVETENIYQYAEQILPDLVEDFVLQRIPTINQLSFMWTLFAMQATPFGMEYYITDNFGLNGELTFGSPYFVSIGLNYRF